MTNIAEKLLQKISHVQVKHIKSHQDSTASEDQLSWPARLNIIADRQATEQREEMEEPAHNVTNTTKGMLHIQGMAVTRNVEQILWRTASGIPIQDYYKARQGWTNTTFHQINWEAQHKALLRFPSADQQRILKFVHNWLPTGWNLHREKAPNTSSCPLCLHDNEDNMHIFNCTAPKQDKLMGELLLHIAKQQHSKEMPELARLIEWALISCRDDDDWTVDKHTYPEELHKAIDSQNEIGWKQIFYGRISVEFGIAQEHFYRWQKASELLYNGQRWTRELIHKIWETMLSLWHNRNKAKHDTEEQAETQNTRVQLQAWAQYCYEQAHTLTAADRNQLFQKTLEERLKDHSRNLQAWITSTKRLIRLNKLEDPHILKARKKMEEFFQWKKKLDTRESLN
jgi:hypothetical protein